MKPAPDEERVRASDTEPAGPVAALESPGGRLAAIPAPLRPLVAHAFVVASPGAHVVWTVPDGTVDLVVSSGETAGVFVAGPAAGPRRHETRGPVCMVGVSLRPGVGALLGPSVGSLLPGEWLPLGDVVGQRARDLMASQTDTALERVFRFVYERAARVEREPRLDRALAMLGAEGGRVRIDRLARAAGASERTLLRLFHDRVGLTPKALARIHRFQRALALIRRGRPLAEIAIEAGYADQAHLAREIRELAGAPASRLAALAGERGRF